MDVKMIGSFLAELRRERGMTQEQISKKEKALPLMISDDHPEAAPYAY